MKIPLAWLQLIKEKSRLLIALAGIAFADILMFVQLGFQAALFDSTVVLHKSFQGEIFLMSPQTDASIAFTSFSSRRLYQALAVDGVTSVSPVNVEFGVWKNPIDRNTRSLMVLGFNPSENIFNKPEISNNLDVIKKADYVLFDQLSREEFGPIAKLYKEGKLVTTEVANQQITVGGLFSLGASFAADGAIITSDATFRRIFPEKIQGLIEIGIISLKPEADVVQVLATLRETLPKDVSIFSRQEFIEHEQNYWKSSTAIGFIFTLGAAIGFMVGTVIVYQILYTDVTDHLPEYATLKAMGYKDGYFIVLVFQEAVILAILGYIPGFAIAIFLYWGAATATNLPIYMTLSRGITVFILTVVMCCISGAIAVRKLRAADPADIF